MSIINGDANANILTGTASADTITGGGGVDTMIGGSGDDLYDVDNTGDVIIENAGEGTDRVVTYVSYTLGANVENLQLNGTAGVNGTGNNLNNVLTGNFGNNILSGGGGNDSIYGGSGPGGADTMIGGTGDDSYNIYYAGVVVIEAANEGIDTVYTTIDYTLGDNVENLIIVGGNASGTGNSLNNFIQGSPVDNTLSGGAGNDTLDGGNGADTLIGGTGNDLYIVDTMDVVIEDAGAGIDTVQTSYGAYTLGANLENLIGALNGTGNSLNNVITGTNFNNILDGAAGSDTLIGGLGNDTYIIDTASDVVVEGLSAGTDTVQSSVSYTLAANVENLTLTGTAALNGSGNALNNVINGNAVNNILNGAAGADTMLGGLGNDTYYVDNAGDIVSESANAGSDTVISSISYKLTANVENLTLTGTGTRNGVGNDLANYIVGNYGNNTLTGGKGSDTYNLGRTSQHDTIIESDSTLGNIDTLRFAADVHYDQLWFKHVGNDLQVDIIGTTNSATIKDFFYSASNHVEVFRAGDGKVLTDTRVQNLVNAMASMTEPGAGMTKLMPADETALASVFAANWK